MTFFTAKQLCYLHVNVPQELDNKYWVSGRSEDEAREKAAAQFGVPASKIILKQGKILWFNTFLTGEISINIGQPCAVVTD